MAKPYVVNISNGTGTAEVVTDSYLITLESVGYDGTSVTPSEIEITGEEDSYDLTVSASGTLTLHVTDDGTTGGIPIVGATFVRCDSNGVTYGNPIVSNEEGNAVFNNVPYAASGAPIVYYKQTASDGEHDFDRTLQQITLEESTLTEEVFNSPPVLKTFNLTDANYNGLPIENGQMTLN